MWGGGEWGHPFFRHIFVIFYLLFESHLRTLVLENFVSYVAQATYYTEIVEFVPRAMYL